ncbi:cation transporter [Methylopila musalis]|uniref:Cation transporter n=1 Tax=Methylopila musalis TaxID=1134781 RepID=A0ABW3Z8Z8_9HYPH
MADTSSPHVVSPPPGLRRTVGAVAALNLGYFGVEFWAALALGSVALFADSMDFLEDASVNLLILLALGWSLKARARVGAVLALILVAPVIATVWTAWDRIVDPTPPNAVALSAVALGALGVNLTCALLLARFRAASGSLTKAAFLSARNDALANLAIIAAGFVTLAWPSIWPDLVVGLAIAALNIDAAWEVWEAAREERLAVTP